MCSDLVIKETLPKGQALLKQVKYINYLLKPFYCKAVADNYILHDVADAKSRYIKQQLKKVQKLWQQLENIQYRLDEYKSTRIKTVLSTKMRQEYKKLKASYSNTIHNAHHVSVHFYSFIMYHIEETILMEIQIEANNKDAIFEKHFDEAWALVSHLSHSPIKDYYQGMLARKKIKYNKQLVQLLLESDDISNDDHLPQYSESHSRANHLYQDNIRLKTIVDNKLHAVVMGEDYGEYAQKDRAYCLAIMPYDAAITDHICIAYNHSIAQIKSMKRLRKLMKKRMPQAFYRYALLSYGYDPIVTPENKSTLDNIYQFASNGHVGCEVYLAKMILEFAVDECQPNLSVHTFGKHAFYQDKEMACQIIHTVMHCYMPRFVAAYYTRVSHHCTEAVFGLLENKKMTHLLETAMYQPCSDEKTTQDILSGKRNDLLLVKQPFGREVLILDKLDVLSNDCMRPIMQVESEVTPLQRFANALTHLNEKQHPNKYIIEDFILNQVEKHFHACVFVYFTLQAEQERKQYETLPTLERVTIQRGNLIQSVNKGTITTKSTQALSYLN